MSSGHERHGFACATPLGPLTKTVFFAAPTLNRSLVVGSPPPADLCQTDSWSFSSTSWVTMCRRADPETGPLDLTRFAVISSSYSGRTTHRHTCAITMRRGAIPSGAVGEKCLFPKESISGRSRLLALLVSEGPDTSAASDLSPVARDYPEVFLLPDTLQSCLLHAPIRF